MLLLQGRGEIAILFAVTAVLFHQHTPSAWIDCSTVSSG